MDRLSPAARAALMQRIRSRETGPELLIRSLIHRLGFRFRTHDKSLPGCPDIVLARHKKVIRVQGCFWHGHGCSIGRTPKSNQSYWHPKIARTQARDAAQLAELESRGWLVMDLWECELGDLWLLIFELVWFLNTERD